MFKSSRAGCSLRDVGITDRSDFTIFMELVATSKLGSSGDVTSVVVRMHFLLDFPRGRVPEVTVFIPDGLE